MSVWRHARAVVLLPGSAAVAVPALILIASQDADPGGPFGAAAGGVLILAGFAMWLWTVRLFARVGEGTLAPWDPTRRLVVVGPYRHVRNPMISAVMLVLLGEAALFASAGLLVWCAVFLVVNWAWFALVEEPGLERRFGDEYRAYRDAVPRWIPRRTPWPMS